MQIFWISLSNINKKNLIDDLFYSSKQNIVFTPNPEILLGTLTDSSFKKSLESADYLTSDGIWLYIAYQINDNSYGKIINTLLLPYYFFNLFFRRSFLYKKYWERICGSDLTFDILEKAIQKNVVITIIDLYNPTDIAKVTSQKLFSQKLSQRFPALHFSYIIYNPEKKEEIISQIQKSDSSILFSTLWMKKQEASVVEIMQHCKNIKIWLGIGSSFDYFTWFQKRAPKIWRSLWIEWLYRIITWPSKLIRLKRLYNAIFVFIFQVIKHK